MHGSTGPVSTPFMYNDPGININPKTNDLWKPIVTAVNGMACGGALYLLGESDVIVAAEHATFFDPHVTYGMVAGFESTHLLQKLPLGEVLRLMLLGAWERMSAERAHQMGLVSEVVPAAELMERAMWVARRSRRHRSWRSGHLAGDLDDPRGGRREALRRSRPTSRSERGSRNRRGPRGLRGSARGRPSSDVRAPATGERPLSAPNSRYGSWLPIWAGVAGSASPR